MKADKTAQGTDPSSIPNEFRENYRFLSELINCEERNNLAARTLEQLVKRRLHALDGKLNRRQTKVLHVFLRYLEEKDTDPVNPPVPAELEAAIRIRKRSTWLPWEAEAIRKIDRWRGDLTFITETWTENPPVPSTSTSRAKTIKTFKKS